MRVLLRLTVASAVLAAAMIANVSPGFAVDTITVTCTNGFERTVAAQAARGVAKSLNKFNEFTKSGVTCSAAAGAPRPAPAIAWLTIECTNGFERRQRPRRRWDREGAEQFNAFSQTGVTCSAA